MRAQLVRLSGGDVRLFERIAPTLIARVGSLDAVERRELLRLVKWMNRNTHLNLALCYQGLGELAQARAHVAHVLARHGEDGDALALRAQLDR